MNRWATLVVGAAIAAVIGLLVWRSGRAPLKPATVAAAGSGAPEATAIDAGGIAEPVLALRLGADGGLGTLKQNGEGRGENDGLEPLPSGSPKTVRFGVILVQYRGAEFAPANARPKQEALTLARSMAEAASTDFKAQVQRGDPGSMEDAGRIPRGVLEPSVEYALFTLPRGNVSEPIDTPRGYWIVRRID